MAIILALALIHARGLGPGRVIQNGLTFLKVGALALFVIAGFTVSSAHVPAASVSGPVRLDSWLMALVPVMFSYTGWNAATYVAEEIRDPERNLPRALALGTVTIVVLYLALNALYLRVVPRDALAGSMGAGRLVAVSRAGARRAGAHVPRVGLPLVAGALLRRQLCGGRQRDRADARRDARRPRRHGRGDSVVLVDAPALSSAHNVINASV